MSSASHKSTKKTVYYGLIFIFILTIVFIITWVSNTNTQEVDNTADGQLHSINDQIDESSPVNFSIKTFTSAEFSELYNNFSHPNTRTIINDFSITNSVEADEVINEIAESLGYKIQSAPIADNFVEFEDGVLLQRNAALSWEQLNRQAKIENIDMRITQGFRSAEDQNAIFIERLGVISPGNIINRSADDQIKQILSTTAVPGYSRHHTGYTIDLACDTGNEFKFEDSACFTWLSKNNYANAKKFGWIPSYPKGILNQGPEPEAWEYVWVGIESLYE